MVSIISPAIINLYSLDRGIKKQPAQTKNWPLLEFFPSSHPRNSRISVHEEVWSLKSILELDHFKETEELNALKGEILEAISKFGDLLKDRIEKCQLLFKEFQSLGGVSMISSQYLGMEAKKEMIFFVETMKKIKEEYNAKLDPKTSNEESPLADEDFGGNAKDMMGVYDEDLQQLIDKLDMGRPSFLNKTIAVVGMAGIGKTTIVKALYNDPVISDYFDTRAFVRVGPDYHLKNILLDLLVCLFPNYNKILGIKKSEHELKEYIHEFFKGKRYLIVLDNVWDSGILDDMMRCTPEDYNGSKIIFTTRLSDRAVGDVHKIHFRNEEESSNLFCRKVFVEDSCPPGLKKFGKKIVKKCGGLPLGIISIANILSKAENVAKNENLLALATEEGSTCQSHYF